jgi:hypothetical protein
MAELLILFWAAAFRLPSSRGRLYLTFPLSCYLSHASDAESRFVFVNARLSVS